MTAYEKDNVTLINGDCMDYLRSLPDNAFDLAVVDPPYGKANATKELRNERGRFGKYGVERTGGTWAAKYGTSIKKWDKSPPRFILLNYNALAEIRLFGERIITRICPLHAVSLSGEN